MRLAFCFSLLVFVAVPLLGYASQTNPATASPLVLTPEPGWDEPSREIQPLTFPDGRTLVTVKNKLYMISPERQIVWSYSPKVPLNAQPVYRPDRNEIGLVGLDLVFVRLDAATGKEIWRALVNGRATFGDLKAFRTGYLVLVYRGAYRDEITPELPDHLSYWGGSDDNWTVDFPIGARLAVAGDRIYAVVHEENNVTLQEIHPPSNASR